MIYNILKPLIRMSLLAFFRRFDIIGEENQPATGPAIYVANHPSALMDPLVAAVSIKRNVNFLAGANWFGKGFKARFYKNHLNMIPVYRPWLANGEKVSNEDMFKDCYSNLAQGKSILLFPEANSITVSRIRELKTGAIRIQSGFEEYMNHNATVPIIPVGINYSNPHEFQSRVVVSIGKPIEYNSNFEGLDKKEIARLKANEMQEALAGNLINISNDDNQSLVRNVNRLFLDTFRKDAEVSHKDVSANFEFAQRVAKAVEYFEKEDPEGYQKTSNRVEAYFNQINAIGVSDDLISETDKIKPSAKKILVVVLGAPFAVLGLLLFVAPYQITQSIFNKKLKKLIDPKNSEASLDEAFTSSLIFGVGLGIFLVWNVLFCVLIGLITGKWLIALGVLILGYPVFRFSLYYSKIALYFKYYFKGKKMKRLHAGQFIQLANEREEILTILKGYQKEFDNLGNNE